MTCGDTQIEVGNLRGKLQQLQTRTGSGRTALDFQFAVSKKDEVLEYSYVKQ